MTFLKHCMEDGLVHIPYDREFMNELNVERFGLEATGKLKFSHPPGTHDDRLWAFALAAYYARLQPTEYRPVAAANTYPRPANVCPQLPRTLWRPSHPACAPGRTPQPSPCIEMHIYKK